MKKIFSFLLMTLFLQSCQGAKELVEQKNHPLQTQPSPDQVQPSPDQAEPPLNQAPQPEPPQNFFCEVELLPTDTIQNLAIKTVQMREKCQLSPEEILARASKTLTASAGVKF